MYKLLVLGLCCVSTSLVQGRFVGGYKSISERRFICVEISLERTLVGLIVPIGRFFARPPKYKPTSLSVKNLWYFSLASRVPVLGLIE